MRLLTVDELKTALGLPSEQAMSNQDYVQDMQQLYTKLQTGATLPLPGEFDLYVGTTMLHVVNGKLPEGHAEAASLAQTLQWIFVTSTDTAPYPWATALRQQYQTQLAAMGGPDCSGCQIGSLKNKFVALVKTALQSQT